MAWRRFLHGLSLGLNRWRGGCASVRRFELRIEGVERHSEMTNSYNLRWIIWTRLQLRNAARRCDHAVKHVNDNLRRRGDHGFRVLVESHRTQPVSPFGRAPGSCWGDAAGTCGGEESFFWMRARVRSPQSPPPSTRLIVARLTPKCCTASCWVMRCSIRNALTCSPIVSFLLTLQKVSVSPKSCQALF